MKGQNPERKWVFKNEQKYEDMLERVIIRLESIAQNQNKMSDKRKKSNKFKKRRLCHSKDSQSVK